MKRLIALIGAVAMSFGLYAEGAAPADNYYSTSFEAADDGVTDKTWAAATAGWTTTLTDAFTLEDQVSDLPYASGRDRRDEMFEGKDANNNFLKLETGTNTLSHGVVAGQVYFDQLVKFTGYEEDPTLTDDAKIAVWLKAIDEDDPETEEVNEIGTNLYVTVGTGNAGTPVAKVQIAKDDMEVDKWYRVTIKSISEVSKVDATSQLGFQIFIDGVAASIVEADRSYNENSDSFTDKAKALYAKGQLFTSITMSDLTLETVAYQGIGGVDDIIFSEEAPDFDQVVEFEVGEVPGVELVKVEGPEGVLPVPYAVMPGSLVKIYVKAADGYRLDYPDPYIEKTISEGGTISIADELEDYIVEGFATLNGEVVGEDELEGMMAGLKEGDKVVFLKKSEIGDDVFAKDTTIDVGDGAWAIVAGGELTLYSDIAVNITLASAGDVYFASAIAAGYTVDATAVTGDFMLDDDIEVAGTLKVSDTFSDEDCTITLGEAGKVWSAAKLDTSIFTNEKVVEAEEADGWAYQLQQATGFAVIIASVTNEYPTLQAAFTAAGAAESAATIVLKENAEADGTLTMGAKNVILDLNGKTLTGDITASAASGSPITTFTIKNGTINGDVEMTNDYMDIYATVNGCVTINNAADLTNIKGTINNPDGTAIVVNGGTVKIANTAVINAETAINAKAGTVKVLSNSSTSKASIAGEIVVADGVTTTITGGEFDSDINNLLADDRMAVKDGDIWKVVPTVAKIGTEKYASLAAAATAAQNGDVVTLLADASADGLEVAADVTFDLNGKKLTVAESFTSTTDIALVNNGPAAGGFLVNGTISVNGGTLDASALTVAPNAGGVIPGQAGSISVAAGATFVMMNVWSTYSPNWLAANRAGFLVAADGGMVQMGNKVWTAQDGVFAVEGAVAKAEVTGQNLSGTFDYVDTYAVLGDALSAVKDGGKVTVLAPTAAQSLTVKANTTLDLNDQLVQALAIVNNGTIIIYNDEVAMALITGVNGNYVAGEQITDGATFDFPKDTTISIVANDPEASAGSTITITSEGTASYGAGIGAKKTYIFNVAALGFAGNVCRGSRVDTSVTVNAPAVLAANLNVGVDDDPSKIDYVTYPDGKAIVIFNDAVTAPTGAKIVLTTNGVVKAKSDISALFADVEGYGLNTATEGDYNVYTLVEAPAALPVAIVVSADGVTTNEFSTLQAAFDAAQAGETVALLDNVALESNIEFANKDITFNLGGFTLSNKNNSGDLYCFNIEASTLVVTNGVIDAGAGEAIESKGASHITIACDAELKGTGAYTFYPNAAIVDIYGKITTTGSELPCIWLTAEGEVVNVYDGAVLTSQGDVFRHRCNTAEVSANSAVLNVYGGEMTSKGYPVVYAYASTGKVNSGYVNVYGGTFIVAHSDGKRPFSKTAEMTYLPLTDECTAKFNCNVDLASYCAPGFAPVKDGDWYVIAKLYDITITDPIEGGTLETSVTNGIAAGTTVTVTPTPAENYELESITVKNGEEPVALGEGNTFVMPAGNVTVAATFKSTAPDFPVKPDEDITEKGKENIATAKEVFGDDLANYIAKVYGEGGKIPASKLNATTPDLIKIAQAYELPIMTEPKVEITKAAEGTAFEFQIVDDGTPVEIQAAKVLSMVEFTSDLGDATKPFAPADAKDVTVAIKDGSAGKTATADFTKETTAGFMRVKLSVPTVAE